VIEPACDKSRIRKVARFARHAGEGNPDLMRPALWGAAALSVGITLSGWVRPHPLLALAIVLLASLWAVRCRGSRTQVASLLALAAALGVFSYSYVQTAGRGDLAVWQDRKVDVVGTVVSEPELRKPAGIGYVVAVEQIGINPAMGKLYLTQRDGDSPGYGERISFNTTLKAPPGARLPGGYDRAAYLARQSVYFESTTGVVKRMGPGSLSLVKRAAVSTRMRLESVLKQTMPPEPAGVLAGLLFGSRSSLPDHVKESFKASGVFHLLAVSGAHIAMLLLPIPMLLRICGLSRRTAAATTVPLVFFFIFLTGASPSILRAGLMAILLLVGEALGRERNSLNTLGAAGCLLLLITPSILFELGFQFSFLATLGILLLARPIQGGLAPYSTRLLGDKVGGWVAAGLSVTLAAQIAVEPLSLHYFGASSAIAPLANLMVLAIVLPIVRVGAIVALLGLVWISGAQILALFVRAGLWLLVSSVGVTSSIPGAYLEPGRLPAVWIPLWYAVVVLAFSPRLRHWLIQSANATRERWTTGSRIHRSAALILVLLFPFTGFTWRLALADPPDTLVVTFLDIGQGDAILIQAPGGISMLVDAGPVIPADPKRGWAGWDAGLEVILPVLRARGIRRLDYMVLTHPDLDHAGGGAAVLREMPVGAVLYSGERSSESAFGQAMIEAARRRIPVHRPIAGDRIMMGSQVVVEVINPPAVLFKGTRSDDNSNCVAFRVTYRKIAMLFTCDVEAVVEERLISLGAPLRADLLKVSHHGSGHSSTSRFLQAVAPSLAVISAGSGNSFGHPHPDTLERLVQVGAKIYRTDRDGTVTAKSDGQTIWMQRARQTAQSDGTQPIGLHGRRWILAW